MAFLNWDHAVGMGRAPASGAAGRALATRTGARNSRAISRGLARDGSTRGRVEPQPRRLRSPLNSIAWFRLRVSGRALSGAIGFLLLLAAQLATAQTPREYQLKAVLLFNFTRFVDWPVTAFAATNSPFVIGILGRHNPFGNTLEELVAGESVGSHKIVVRHFDSEAEIHDCQILFITRAESRRLPRILSETKGRPILTVSDMDDFGRLADEIIGMYRSEANKIRLRINLDAARAVNLKISAKLLRVAEVEARRTP